MHEQGDIPVRVLIGAGAEAVTHRLLEEMRRGGFAPAYARVTTANEVRAALARETWDAIIIDADSVGSAALEMVRACSTAIICLVVAESLEVEQAVAFMHAGAYTVLQLHQAGRLPDLLRETCSVAQQQHEQQRAVERLRITNRALRLLSTINQGLIRATDEKELQCMACQIAVEIAGYRFAWVGIADTDEEKTVRPSCYAGYEAGYLEAIRVTWADDEFGRGPTGTAIRTLRPSFIRDVAREPSFLPWHVPAEQRGYR